MVSHHVKHCYYTAKVAAFDRKERTFTVDWDDGDQKGRTQPYRLVCKHVPPAADEVGVGTVVLFTQGKYNFEGHRLDRYHEGRVTAIERGADGEAVYVGEHTKGEADGKWVTYKDYERTFRRPLAQLRVAGNLMATLSVE